VISVRNENPRAGVRAVARAAESENLKASTLTKKWIDPDGINVRNYL
jgi:stage V sporulation protein SpoVS